MKKALLVATVGRFMEFERNDIRLLQRHGYEVHCAVNLKESSHDGMEDFPVIRHQIDFARSPFSKSNMMAYRQLKKLLKEEAFDLIHCHTPVGGVFTRMAARRLRRKGTRVFYTAHGFHFYKGAPKQNWMIFYPIEWLCSWWTDIQITVNEEDYRRARKQFHAKQTYYIPGVGIDIEKFHQKSEDPEKTRQELGVRPFDIMLLSVGELSVRKNHKLLLQAMASLRIRNIRLFLCGEGPMEKELRALTKSLDLEGQVVFLGYREDIVRLCQAADCFIMPSRQEGLSVALMEAAAAGTPILSSRIRGSVDLLKEEACLFDPDKVEELVSCIRKKLFGKQIVSEQMENQMEWAVTKETAILADRKQLAENMRQSVEENFKRLQRFSIEEVSKRMEKIYFPEI